MNKRKWKIVLFLGITPFLAAILSGFYAAITGFSGFAIMSPNLYGWAAFTEWIVLYSFIFWPTYVIGLVLILLAVAKLIASEK